MCRRSILTVLPTEILLRIVELLPSSSRKALRLVCRSFLRLDHAHRTRLVVLRREALPALLRRYSRSLESLDLSRCPAVDGRALAGGGTHPRLRRVDLSRCNTIRWWGLEVLIGSCPNLEEVELSYCGEVGDREMAVVGRAKGLRRLGVARCLGVTDVGLANVAVGCPRLEDLCLRWCLEISDIGIHLLANKCRGLSRLDISYLKVTNESLRSISTLEGLESLTMVGCALVDNFGLAYLNNGYHSLKSIDVSRCDHISPSGLIPVIRGHNFLQKINAGYCCPQEISVPFISELQRSKNHLRTLTMDGFHVSIEILESFGLHCKKLVEIGLSKCNGVTDEGISKLVSSMSSLGSVDLTCCHQITDGALTIIAEFCKDLKCLKLESCTSITEKGLNCIANHCIHLKEIDLTDCAIDDTALKWLSKCSELVELKLGYCPDITDQGLFHIGSTCSHLQSLDLYRCTGIGDDGLSHIARGCKRLKKLNICYCSKISDKGLYHLSSLQEMSELEMRKLVKITGEGIAAVAAGCRNLVELDVKRCYSVDDNAIRALAHHLQNLRQINLSYTAISDVGLCFLLGSLRCLQDAKLIHLSRVSVEGLERAILASGYKLKKLKLLAGLRELFSPAVIQMVQSYGCRLRWVDKPLVMG